MPLQFIHVVLSAYPIVPFIVCRNYFQSIETVYTTVYPRHPIRRAYCTLIVQRNHYQSIIPSADLSIHIILSPHHNILKQLISTPSGEPINQIMSSLQHQNILNFISFHPISRSNKSDYPVTLIEEPITVYFLSPHHKSQEMRLSTHSSSISNYIFFPIIPLSEPINQITLSPHHNNLLHYISRHSISTANKYYYTITPSVEPIIIYSLSYHKQIYEIKLTCHPVIRAYYILFTFTWSKQPINHTIP